MADEHHQWKLGGLPPLIRPHSLAKHRIIEKYLHRYVNTITSNPSIPLFRLTLVDGFAGGGLYRDSLSSEERYGSPLLMLKAMRTAREDISNCRKQKLELDVEFYFIERDRDAFSHLDRTLRASEFAADVARSAHILNDEFSNQVPRIIERVKARKYGERAIFVLDQFGYSDVPMPQIRLILEELKQAEIILTFATDSLIDYMSDNDTTQKILERVGLPIGRDQIKTAKQANDWRWAIQAMLHKQIHQQSGARFFTPFFIRSIDSHRDFWLIHLSGHARARDVMVDLHWTENTSLSHYGRSGLQMLGYDQNEDVNLTRQSVLPIFKFDKEASDSTRHSLMAELPGRISEHNKAGGIPFWKFFEECTNESPATSEDFRMAIAELVAENAIVVRHSDGHKTRLRGVCERSDILLIPRQKLFQYPK